MRFWLGIYDAREVLPVVGLKQAGRPKIRKFAQNTFSMWLANYIIHCCGPKKKNYCSMFSASFWPKRNVQCQLMPIMWFNVILLLGFFFFFGHVRCSTYGQRPCPLQDAPTELGVPIRPKIFMSPSPRPKKKWFIIDMIIESMNSIFDFIDALCMALWENMFDNVQNRWQKLEIRAINL